MNSNAAALSAASPPPSTAGPRGAKALASGQTAPRPETRSKLMPWALSRKAARCSGFRRAARSLNRARRGASEAAVRASAKPRGAVSPRVAIVLAWTLLFRAAQRQLAGKGTRCLRTCVSLEHCSWPLAISRAVRLGPRLAGLHADEDMRPGRVSWPRATGAGVPAGRATTRCGRTGRRRRLALTYRVEASSFIETILSPTSPREPNP
jgi:hypothetical protein